MTTTSTIPAADGRPISVHEWTPERDPRAVVVIAHGMAEHARRYEALAADLTAAGYAVLAHDHLGHGEGAEQLGWFAERDGWATVVDDMRRVVAHAHERWPDQPVVLLGHSMGSLLARQYVIDDASDVDALVLSGTAVDPGIVGRVGRLVAGAEARVRGSRHPSRLMNRLTFGSYNKGTAGRTEFDWLSRDEAVVDDYIEDPLSGSVHSSGFFVDLLGGVATINRRASIARVRTDLPIYVVAGEADPVGGKRAAGPRRVAQLHTAAGVKDVTLKIYPGARHEVFNETNRDEVVADLLAWLDTRV